MYGKIFSQMYDGTLATRGPWQALVTFQQLIVLCDQKGIVDMTHEAIARRTTIPLDIVHIGIAALEAPDPDSRTPTHEGRRILRLSDTRNWGWQIVNYAHYRSLRSLEERREYMRQYQRERRAVEALADSASVNRCKQSNPCSKQEAGSKKKAKVASANGAADQLVSGFPEFWAAYPRKKSKGAAEVTWGRLNPGQELQQQILAAVTAAKASAEWLAEGGKYIPYPATWLKARGWEDELPSSNKLDCREEV